MCICQAYGCSITSRPHPKEAYSTSAQLVHPGGWECVTRGGTLTGEWGWSLYRLTSQEIGKGYLNRLRIEFLSYCLVIFYKIVVLLRVCTYNNKYVGSVCGENVCSYSGSGGETVLCYDDDR